MKTKLVATAFLLCVPLGIGCGVIGDQANLPGADQKFATIVGQVMTSAQKNHNNQNTNDNSNDNTDDSPICPAVEVSLNGAPVDIEFDDSCSFLINRVAPAPLVELQVSIASLGLTNTAELTDVVEGDVIELLVEVGEDSLGITITRRTTPDPSDALPEVICDNNVSIELAAGLYQQNLAVVGNKFLLMGEAGDLCTDDGWTTIEGDVTVNGNSATFKNIKFIGNVTVNGNKATFINCCLDDALVNFGRREGNGGGKDDFGCRSDDDNENNNSNDDDDDDDDDD